MVVRDAPTEPLIERSPFPWDLVLLRLMFVCAGNSGAVPTGSSRVQMRDGSLDGRLVPCLDVVTASVCLADA